ncbi:MAG: response regulator [Candidatus Poribacteria bacterium]|nr:response regulator [Candidatus Poribacteria bacterium]
MARILVVDDEEGIRTALCAALEHIGHEVVGAPDGEMGLRLYREKPTDLVILDIFMPEKEGLEAIMELKRDFPDVKIIAISGGGTVVGGWDPLTIAEHLGAVRTFTKPFALKEIIEAVRELVDVSTS